MDSANFRCNVIFIPNCILHFFTAFYQNKKHPNYERFFRISSSIFSSSIKFFICRLIHVEILIPFLLASLQNSSYTSSSKEILCRDVTNITTSIRMVILSIKHKYLSIHTIIYLYTLCHTFIQMLNIKFKKHTYLKVL
jgi:hypothetical protein